MKRPGLTFAAVAIYSVSMGALIALYVYAAFWGDGQ